MFARVMLIHQYCTVVIAALLAKVLESKLFQETCWVITREVAESPTAPRLQRFLLESTEMLAG